MRFTIAAVLTGVAAAAAKALDPSWSFASTTTIIDKNPWYTVNIPFLTTVTTSVSGTTETVTKTEVSISIGTKSPSTLLPDTSTNRLADPRGPVDESGGVVARQVLESTEELITYTHSHPQSSTIDDSDVLPTTIPVGGYGGPIPSLTAHETVTTVTSSEASPTSHSSPLGYGGGDETVATVTSTEASPATLSSPLGYGGGDETITTATSTEVSLTTHSSPLGYGGGDETSSTPSNVQVTATVTVTVSGVAPTTTTSTSKSPGPSTLTFTVTYGTSPVETILFTTVVGSSSVLAVTGTATSTSVASDIPSMSILPYPSIDSSSPPGGYGGEESSSTIPATTTRTVDIPPVLTPPLPPTTAQDSTTFITVKATSTYTTTTSSGGSLPPYGSSTAEPVTGTPSSAVTLWPSASTSCDEEQQTTSFSYAHPTVTGFLPSGNVTVNATGYATGNATYTRTWSWSKHTHPHLSLPTQGASTLVKIKRGAKNTVVA